MTTEQRQIRAEIIAHLQRRGRCENLSGNDFGIPPERSPENDDLRCAFEDEIEWLYENGYLIYSRNSPCTGEGGIMVYLDVRLTEAGEFYGC